MAPRSSRRQSNPDVVPDSESDDEEDEVSLENSVRSAEKDDDEVSAGNNARSAEQDDDEVFAGNNAWSAEEDDDEVTSVISVHSEEDDDVVSAARSASPQAQDAIAARNPVEELLGTRGVRPRTQWLVCCMNELAAMHSGFAGMSVARQAELCFGQFLMADFNMAGAASLPPSMHTLHNTELPGPFVLQVDEVTDIAQSLRDRYEERLAGPRRTLKLSMTDGVQRVTGMEYRPVKVLQVLSPAGLKISLRNVSVRRGSFMLVPEVLKVLGGVVEQFETARLKAVQLIKEPPRGKRTRQGIVDPSLAERATQAAWSASRSQGDTEPGARNNHPEQHRSHTDLSYGTESTLSTSGATPAVRQQVTTAAQRREEFFVREHQRPESRGQSVPLSHIQQSVSMASLQQGEGQLETQHQSEEAREQSAPISQFQSSVRMDSVQQRKTMQQATVTNERRQPHQASAEFGASQQQGHHQSVLGDQEAIPSRDSISISGTQSARSGHVHGPETSSTIQQGQGVESRKQRVSCEVEETTSKVHGEMNGQGAPSSQTTKLGRQTLQSHRLVQSNLQIAPVIQQCQAMEWDQSQKPPLQSLGGIAGTPMDLDDSEESDGRTSTVSSSPVAEFDDLEEEVPFSYLAALKERANSHKFSSGKVKCVIVGVNDFNYKYHDDFKLQVLIEDGTSNTAAWVQHQEVVRLLGYSPREVIARLTHHGKNQEMVKELYCFKKFLEDFEGIMDVEFLDSSSVPTILQMREGFPPDDIQLVADRVHCLMNRKHPNGNVSNLTVDLSKS